MTRRFVSNLMLLMVIVTMISVPALAGTLQINGAGASFPYPIYSKWFDEYRSVDPSVQINYQSIGSGAGIQQITAGTVDFGASDGPMTDEQLSKAPRELVHIPTVIGAVSVVYNVPGINPGLKLDGETLANIFLGNITMWNDQRIAALNPGVKLPNVAIAVAHRSDGSGTTFIFSDYLSAVSSEWKSRVGNGTSLRWPTGIGAKGNEGVAGLVRQIPGSIGYVEQAYAQQNNLTQAALKNKAGYFVMPSLEGASLAAAGVTEMPADYRVSIVNSEGKDTYPIASFTWLLIYKDAPNKEKGQKIAEFLWWMIHDGQDYAGDLLYASLPPSVVAKLEVTLKGLTYNGEPLLKK